MKCIAPTRLKATTKERTYPEFDERDDGPEGFEDFHSSKRSAFLGSHSSRKDFHKRFGRRGRRSRVLSRNDTAIHDGEALPVGRLLVKAADALQLILNEK